MPEIMWTTRTETSYSVEVTQEDAAKALGMKRFNSDSEKHVERLEQLLGEMDLDEVEVVEWLDELRKNANIDDESVEIIDLEGSL
jgi:hypothetical protein